VPAEVTAIVADFGCSEVYREIHKRPAKFKTAGKLQPLEFHREELLP